jgi:hypothetical protein
MHEDLARGSDPAKEDQMRILPIATAVAALTIVTAAVAQQAATPTNKADCEKAKMKWDEKGGKEGKGACIAATPAPQPPKK